MRKVTELRRDVDLVSVVHQLADAIVLADRDMTIVFANDSASKLFGIPTEVMIGRPLTELVPPRLRNAHTKGFNRYLATGQPRLIGGPPIRVAALDASGTEVPIELALGALGSPGDEDFLAVASMRDVSKHVALEREASSARYLQAMLSVIGELQSARDEATAARRVLPTLCSNLDLRGAALWLTDESDGLLHCVDSWEPAGGSGSFAAASLDSTLELGTGLAGTCARAGRPVSLAKSDVPPDWTRSRVFEADDVSELVAFPLLGPDLDVLGVVELLSDGPGTLRRDLEEVLLAIGQQVGMFLGRIRTDEQRRLIERDRTALMQRMLAAERSQSFLLQASRILARATSYAE
ncbi:MAG: PAS domain S-box protein, partial [Acidimicrobiales bacterium]